MARLFIVDTYFGTEVVFVSSNNLFIVMEVWNLGGCFLPFLRHLGVVRLVTDESCCSCLIPATTVVDSIPCVHASESKQLFAHTLP